MLTQPLNFSAFTQQGSSNPSTPPPMQSSTSQIPLSNQPVDIRSKFDASYNPLVDRQSEVEVIKNKFNNNAIFLEN